MYLKSQTKLSYASRPHPPATMSRYGTCHPRTPTYSRGHRCRRAKTRDWQEGEIAYLKSSEFYSSDDWRKLEINPERPFRASNHPVIILKKGKPTTDGQFYLVTTVSAYSSDAENNYLPPWCQRHHRYKNRTDFRSLSGCELVNDKRKPLYLEPGQSMPKPQASWVYIQSVHIVPAGVLGFFTKSPVQLRVTPESLQDLVGHMKERCAVWTESVQDKRICASDNPSEGVQQVLPPQIEVIAAPTKATPPTAAEVAKTPAPEPKAGPASIAHKRSWASIAKGEGTSTSPDNVSTPATHRETGEPAAKAPKQSIAASSTITPKTCRLKPLKKWKSMALATAVVA